MHQTKMFFMLFVTCWSCSMTVSGVPAPREPLRSYMMDGDENIHTTNSRSDLDCSQFSSDYDILYHFPFHIIINPINDAGNKSSAFMNDNGTLVDRLNLVNETTVPLIIFCLQNLQELRITGSPFPDYIVPDNLENLRQLRQLAFFNTPIVSITERLGTMSNLAVLYLQNCTLTDLPNLSGIPNLQYIDLRENQLSNVEGLTGVVNLDLSNNLFTDIPTLNTPNTLRYLDMNNNPVENMLAITSHVNLNRVLLRNTTLSFIPATIDRLQQLRSLDLSYNKLFDIPMNMLNLVNLQYLDIQKNLFSSTHIQEFETQSNRVLPNLSIVT